jgi:hypothetical protein
MEAGSQRRGGSMALPLEYWNFLGRSRFAVKARSLLVVEFISK